MSEEKITLKTLKRFTKKELIQLVKDHLNEDIPVRGLSKLKKPELIMKITGAPKWPCVKKVIKVKPKRKRTEKQKAAFEKMRMSVGDQLLSIKGPKKTDKPKVKVSNKLELEANDLKAQIEKLKEENKRLSDQVVKRPSQIVRRKRKSINEVLINEPLITDEDLNREFLDVISDEISMSVNEFIRQRGGV